MFLFGKVVLSFTAVIITTGLQNSFNLTVETVIFQELDIAILVEQDDMAKNIYPNIHLKI